MSAQPSLFDLPHAPAIRVPCDPDGPVVQGPADETLRLPHPRLAWDLAAIELHRADCGRWMWSVSLNMPDCSGSSYKVGPKWGRFAETRDDALFYAVQEARAKIEGNPGAEAHRKWLDSLL